MRKNILIFGHSFGPQFIDINNQYTDVFDKNQFEVTVVYLTGEPDEAIRQKHTADEVIFLNSPKKSIRHLKMSVIKKMLTLCRKKNFARIICHRYKPSYIMMWVAQFIKLPPCFFVMHELNTLSSFARKMTVAVLARETMFFAGVSDAVRDDIRRSIWRVPAERVITLHNMIDVEKTESQLLEKNAARKHLNLSADDFLFGNMGRLVKNKDQETLIRAFAKIKPACPRAKLVIVGKGELETFLKNLAQELHVASDVIFTGFLQDSFRYMKAFDAYISSSSQEAFGRVLLEAMIAEIPIIATAVHGVPEVVGNAGPLIPAKNPEKLATEMLNAYQSSSETLQHWGKVGYLRAKQTFSHQKFMEIFWQLPVNQSI